MWETNRNDRLAIFGGDGNSPRILAARPIQPGERGARTGPAAHRPPKIERKALTRRGAERFPAARDLNSAVKATWAGGEWALLSRISVPAAGGR